MAGPYYVDCVAGFNPNWIADTVYNIGDIVCPLTHGGDAAKYVYECTARAGDFKSGASEPSPWVFANENDETTDDQITWQRRAPTTWAKALNDIQGAIDLAAAGETVYCRGTQTTTAAIDFDGADGLLDSFISFIGVPTTCAAEPPTAGDIGTTLTDRFIIDGAGASRNVATANAKDYVRLLNIGFYHAGGTSNGLSGLTANSSYWTVMNCRFHGNAGYGAGGAYLVNAIFKQCLFDANGNGITAAAATLRCLFCRFATNTTYGIESGTSGFALVYNCIFTANGTAYRAYGGLNVINCVMDGNTTGFAEYGATAGLLLGVRITDATTCYSTASGKFTNIDYLYADGELTQADMYFLPDKSGATHYVESGGDTADGYDGTTLNLDPDTATYFNEALVIPDA